MRPPHAVSSSGKSKLGEEAILAQLDEQERQLEQIRG
jgi:hypothetical protein